MKHFLAAILSLFFVTSTGLASITTYPECFRGTLTNQDGSIEHVILIFSSINRDLAFVKEFNIGKRSLDVAGILLNENEVVFNENNDSIPGGNASFNIDIYLKFDGDVVTGYLKEYQMEDGYGGFGQSDPKTLRSSGTFNLKKCTVRTIDL